MKKAGKYFFSVLVFLLTFELILKLAGMFVSFEQTHANKQRLHEKNSHELRILCLGESTTASFFAGSDDIAWPRIFEKEMNAKADELGFKTVVFNEAYPGTNSELIRMKLPAFIEKYRPDAVVTMMGINDGESLSGLKSRKAFWYSVLMNFQTFKVINYFFPFEEKKFYVQGIANEPIIDGPIFDRITAYIHDKAPMTVEKLNALYAQVKPELLTPERRGLYHTSVAGVINVASLRGEYAPGETRMSMFSVCDEYLEQNFKEDEVVDFTFYVQFLCGGYNAKSVHRVTQRTLEHYKNGFKLNDQMVAQMLGGKWIMNAEDYNEVLKAFELEKSEDSPFLWMTQESYQSVARLLKENDILYFSMMYPSGNLNALKMLFGEPMLQPRRLAAMMYLKDDGAPMSPEFKEVIPVTNEDFLKKCKPEIGECYKDVWTTAFGGKFGHTTEKGHRMIADNLMKAMLENKDRLKAQLQ